MKKIYFTLAMGAIMAACSTESANSANDRNNENGDFDKIKVETGTLEDARDGKTYKTVTIKDQTWMAENLNYEVENSSCAEGDSENCEAFGRLYTWTAAMDSATTGCGYTVVCDLADSIAQPKVQGICPEGWHIPTDSEWDTLIEITGDADHAAQALKSKDVWTRDAGEDTYKFSVLPTGYRGEKGDYTQPETASFWASTEFIQTSANTDMYPTGKYSKNACARYMDRDISVKHRSYDKRTARSIRCIKD